MGIEFDPNDYEDKSNGGGAGAGLLPVGKHIVRVTDHELGETNSGLTQLIVTFEARDGRTRKAWLIAEGPAGFQLATLFRVCGWTSKISLSASGTIKKAIYGKDIEIVVADDTYNGVTKPKVKWINKAPGGSGERPEPRGSVRGLDAQRDQGRDEAPPPNDDDIPF